MNRYQRQRSKEIKQIMKRDKFGRMKYSEARRIWRIYKVFAWCSPCEDCWTGCKKNNVIAFCYKRH